ncbi:unnamed protein product [Moneuplotes crassus]|uniref:Uncharacterized protein n=1 Tax=Euplotes crassus TaxID=5936 RepID=A0AAD1XT64_EUPCR|nr:unnamed protein product [Moneuplotes crassus]
MKLTSETVALSKSKREKEIEIMGASLDLDNQVLANIMAKTYGGDLAGCGDELELNLSTRVDQLCLRELKKLSNQKSLGIYAQISINTGNKLSECKELLKFISFLKLESLTLTHTERACDHLDLARMKNGFFSVLQNTVHELNLIHFSIPKEILTSILEKGAHIESIGFHDCAIDLAGVRTKRCITPKTRCLDFTGSTFRRGFSEGNNFSDFFAEICRLIKSSYTNTPLEYIICQKWSISEEKFKDLLYNYNLTHLKFFLTRCKPG